MILFPTLRVAIRIPSMKLAPYALQIEGDYEFEPSAFWPTKWVELNGINVSGLKLSGPNLSRPSGIAGPLT